ncbi:MAG: IMP cyclohydrolase [Spirochaetales bacterium]|nr:IMP cyclohydrolase [Spirochaetales bacterium]
MVTKDFKSAYKTIMDDHFPGKMKISFYDDKGEQTLFYEKVSWQIGDIMKGLRYGENPGQESALYKLINGNLHLGDVSCIQPGQYLASDIELLQSGKHPGKTNITDADNAINILRYFTDTPTTVIVKHNNPCGVAKGKNPAESYYRANMADRVAAFGGAIALNRAVDRETAELVLENYSEVIIAPDFEAGVLDMLKKKKNLRVMKIGNMKRLKEFIGKQVVDFKSLVDGGIIVQWSYVPVTKTKLDLLPAQTTYKDKEYKINRLPTEAEYEDLLFGWFVESGVTSNSVIYVKDGATVGIGTGEQDRVGVAEIARDKAYRKLADRICWGKYKIPYNVLTDRIKKEEIDEEVNIKKGGLIGCCMVSDAFFPFRDGVEVGIREGITAIVQPGGSERDFESIEACNEANVTMVYTGQRSFKH